MNFLDNLEKSVDRMAKGTADSGLNNFVQALQPGFSTKPFNNKLYFSIDMKTSSKLLNRLCLVKKINHPLEISGKILIHNKNRLYEISELKQHGSIQTNVYS